jgi:DNA repair protein RAD5
MLHIKGLEPDAKAVVFSQFLGMIDLIEEYMKKENISYVVNNSFIQRMDGSLSQKERSTVIDKFKNDPRCRIFIISLKSGGVGLNLVVANRVFLVDPWWNPAVEEQAIERVHRIGQKRKVEVVRLIVENSIESRMMELHEGKRNLSAMAMSDKEAKEGSLEKFRYLMSKY